MICGRQGDDGTLLQSFDGDACECPDEEFFDAGLKALFRAFGAASEAMLEGEEERGGAEMLGDGGNVMLTLLEPLLFVGIGVGGIFPSCNGHRGWDVISRVISQMGNDGEGVVRLPWTA